MPRILSIVEDTMAPSSTVSNSNEDRKIPASNQEEDEIDASSDQERRRSDDETIVSYFQSSLFATILEDTVIQLRILAECNTELRIIKTKFDMPHLLAVKFNITHPEFVDDLERIDPKRLDSDEYKIEKLDADRKYITNVITSTYKELVLDRTFKVVNDEISSILALDSYRESMAEEEAKNKLLRRELYRQLRQQRNHYKSVIYDTDVRIESLKSELEDSVLLSETKNRYIDNWQTARTEQHAQTIHDKERVHSEAVDYYKQRTGHEQRVHMEIEMLMNISINETLRQIENWMDKYDTDMEEIDLQVQIKKCAYQDMVTKRIHLEETIIDHRKQIVDWVAFKDARAKALAYSKKMTQSAIIVQAWWRGLCVRLKMGPYKVAKRAKAKLAGAGAAAMMKKTEKA